MICIDRETQPNAISITKQNSNKGGSGTRNVSGGYTILRRKGQSIRIVLQ